MNLDILKGNWKQLKGNIKSEFAKLTDDDVQEAEGDTEALIGKIQEKYGTTKQEAEEKLDSFLKKHS